MTKMFGDIDLGDYAPVADRILLFYERHPGGRIITELVSRWQGEVLFKALVYRGTGDPHPAATGWALEKESDGEVNQVACVENTETSAIGRALANLGFTASARRPSCEEMEKAARGRAGRAEGASSQSRDVIPRQARRGAARAVDDMLQRRAAGDGEVLRRLPPVWTSSGKMVWPTSIAWWGSSSRAPGWGWRTPHRRGSQRLT